jgi:ribonuclease D
MNPACNPAAPAPAARVDPPPLPSAERIAAMPPFERLGLERIALVASAAQAGRMFDAIASCDALGFDTESKPTFVKGEVSDGPHTLQLASDDAAWVVQLHDVACRAAIAEWLRSNAATKVGFGLGDDRRRILVKLGVEVRGLEDLNAAFRRRGYRTEVGVKTSVALLFGRRFMKSGKAGTSNWAAATLAESQLLYAANDAWAALRVYRALHAPPRPAPG